MAQNLYNTADLLSAVEQMVKPKSFLRDRYFPTNPNTDYFSTEDVLIEIKDGNKKLAPFVTPIKGGVLMEREATRMERFTPPSIAPSRLLTVDMLKKRGFGEALYSKLKPGERARQITLNDISDLSDAITRREEKMCSDLLFTNKCVMKHINDDENKTIDFQIDFSNNGNNGTLYTPNATWDSTTPWATIEADIWAMIKMLTTEGKEASDLLCGSLAISVLKNNAEFIKQLDTKNLDAGALGISTDIAGAALLGYIIVMGHKLNVITYDETYEDDETGEIVPFVPTTSIVITAPACGHTSYGSTTLLEGEGDAEDYVDYIGARVPQYISDKKHGTREIILHSHPLPLPKKVNPWVTAEVVEED